MINGAEAEPLGIVLYFAGEQISPTIRASMTIKAVLLDFDQTLADSAEGFRLAEKNAETSIFEVNHFDYLLIRQITFVTAGSFLCLSS